MECVPNIPKSQMILSRCVPKWWLPKWIWSAGGLPVSLLSLSCWARRTGVLMMIIILIMLMMLMRSKRRIMMMVVLLSKENIILIKGEFISERAKKRRWRHGHKLGHQRPWYSRQDWSSCEFSPSLTASSSFALKPFNLCSLYWHKLHISGSPSSLVKIRGEGAQWNERIPSDQ